MDSVGSVGWSPSIVPVPHLEQQPATMVLWMAEDALAPVRRKLLPLLQSLKLNVILLSDADMALADRYLTADYLWVWVMGDDFHPILPPYPFAQSCQFDSHALPQLFIWDVRPHDHFTDPRQKERWLYFQNLPSDRLSFLRTDDPLQVTDYLRNTLLQPERSQPAIEYQAISIVLASEKKWQESCVNDVKPLQGQPVLVIDPATIATQFEYIVEECLKSEHILLFYQDQAEWAHSFACQLWKTVGGAGSGKRWLLVGDKDVAKNKYFKWSAPHAQTILTDAKGFGFAYAKIIQEKPIPDTVNPYNGLRPFTESDALYFCGRERLTNILLKKLAKDRLAVVAGASGDGKSSLIFAGLIPALKAGSAGLPSCSWKTIAFKPENTPLRNLAWALAHSLRLDDRHETEDRLSLGFNALARLLKDYLQEHPNENILILLDQFEEFFTHADNFRDGQISVSAQWTVSLLTETVKLAQAEQLPIYVVCTMRSDYIGQCVAFRNFDVGEHLFFVPRLQRLEIKQVIEQPIRLAGGKIAHRLTQRLLNDVSEGNDQLPVLQHCLQQIHRTALADETLDLIHYAEVGGLAPNYLDENQRHEWNNRLAFHPQNTTQHQPGLRNVLNQHADELVNHVHEYYAKRYGTGISASDCRKIIRTAFTGLTRMDEGKPVRQRITLDEITKLVGKSALDHVIVGRVLNFFREKEHTFLLPAITPEPETHDLEPNTLLDITHEALIRNWEQLKQWVEDDHKNERLFMELTTQFHRWEQHQRSSPYLLNSGLSAFFTAWYWDLKPNAEQIKRYVRHHVAILQIPTPSEGWSSALEDFLKKSLHRNRRAQRIAQFGLAVIIGLFAVTVYLYYNVLHKAQETEQKNTRIIAQQNELSDKQRIINEQLAGEAEAANIKSENERLARERARLEEQVRQDSLMGKVRNAEKDIEIERLRREQSEKEIRLKQIERDQALRDKELALIRNQEVAQLNAKITAESQQTSQQRDQALIAQSLFLANKANEQTYINNPDIGILLSLEALPNDLSGTRLSRPFVPQAEASLYFATDHFVNRYPSQAWTDHRNKITSNTYSHNGTKIVSTSWDRTAKVRDAKTGILIKEIYHPHIVSSAVFSKDDRFLLTVTDDFTARLYDGKFFSIMGQYSAHSDFISHAEMSPDGTHLLLTSYDKTATLWNIYEKKPIAVLKGHTQAVIHGAFSPDGSKMITVSQDHTARLWETQTGKLITTLVGHSRPLTHAVFSPDGKMIATASKDQSIRLWNAYTGQTGNILVGHGGAVQHIDFDPSSGRLASASTDGTVRIWNVYTATATAVFREHQQEVYFVKFSKDGKKLISSGRDGSTCLRDARFNLFLTRYSGQADYPYHAALCDDGKRILFAGKDLQLREYLILPEGQQLLSIAKSFVKNRSLSLEERKRFHINDDIPSN